METWTALFGWVTAHASQIIAAGTSIVGGFAIIASFTPNQSDDAIVNAILKGINFLGFNLGKARNDPAVK